MLDRRTFIATTGATLLVSSEAQAALQLTGFARSFFKWLADKIGGLAVEESIKSIFSPPQITVINKTNEMLRSGSFTNFSNSNVYFNGSTTINNTFYVAESQTFERGACATMIDFESGLPPSMVEGAAIFSLMRKATKYGIVNGLGKPDIRSRLMPKEVVLPPQSGDVYKSYTKPIIYPTKFGAVAIDWQRTGENNGVARIGVKKEGERNFDTDELAWCFRDKSCSG